MDNNIKKTKNRQRILFWFRFYCWLCDRLGERVTGIIWEPVLYPIYWVHWRLTVG